MSLKHLQLEIADIQEHILELDLYDFSNTPLGDYFLGWYAGSGINETKITSYTSISENITLTAKFDIEKIETEYYTEGLIFRLTQNEEILLSDTNLICFNKAKSSAPVVQIASSVALIIFNV